MDNELDEIKRRLAVVEAENKREWDLIKTYFAKTPRMPSTPKAWRKVIFYAVIVVWQLLSPLIKLMPDEFLDLFS